MKRLDSEDRAGLYITVIFHLVVLIVLLASQIGAALKKENTFVIDFSKQEEVQRQEEKVQFKEEISKRLDDLLSSSVPVRNVAVDRSRAALKDDRNTNAEELYKEAERLAKELKDGFKVEENDEDYVAENKPQPRKETPSKQTYTGPSVVSYDLDGRKASRLSIPAYRCMGAGYVTVIIAVDPSGNVLNARVQDDVSSGDACLRSFAIRAARLSKFSASASAPPRQIGNIVYMFIAQ